VGGAGEGEPRFERLPADPQTSMRHARAAPAGCAGDPGRAVRPAAGRTDLSRNRITCPGVPLARRRHVCP
jgi:hypothetical protein